MPTNWGSRNFNGTSDVITVTNNSSIQPSSQITLAGWYFGNDSTFAHWQHIIVKPAAATWISPYVDWMIRIEAAGSSSPKKVTFFINNASATNGAIGTTTFASGQWYHVAGSFDTATLRAYVNGSIDGTKTLGFTPINTNSQNLHLGFSQTGDSSGNLNGNLADCAVWNIALSASEIKALATGARPNNVRPGNLVAWWPLDGLQSPEEDLSGNKNNGTLTGTAAAFGPPYAPFAPRWPQWLDVGVAPPPVFVLMPQIVT
jgi:hypothetical protein